MKPTIILALLLGLAACGGDDEPEPEMPGPFGPPACFGDPAQQCNRLAFLFKEAISSLEGAPYAEISAAVDEVLPCDVVGELLNCDNLYACFDALDEAVDERKPMLVCSGLFFRRTDRTLVDADRLLTSAGYLNYELEGF